MITLACWGWGFIFFLAGLLRATNDDLFNSEVTRVNGIFLILLAFIITPFSGWLLKKAANFNFSASIKFYSALVAGVLIWVTWPPSLTSEQETKTILSKLPKIKETDVREMFESYSRLVKLNPEVKEEAKQLKNNSAR